MKLSIYLLIQKKIYLSIHLSMYLSIYLSISIYLSMSLYVFPILENNVCPDVFDTFCRSLHGAAYIHSADLFLF